MEQEAERREKYLPKPNDATNPKNLEVLISESGVMSARPISETVEKLAAVVSSSSDLPNDLAGRDELIAAGITNLETLVSLDKEALMNIEGIGEKTAEKILKYGENK